MGKIVKQPEQRVLRREFAEFKEEVIINLLAGWCMLSGLFTFGWVIWGLIQWAV